MSSLDDLLADLTSENETRAEAAAASLAQLGKIDLKPLESLFQSPIPDHRWWVVRTLAQMEAPPMEWLVHALDDPSIEVREAAALALTAHPTEQAVKSLLRVLGEADGILSTLASNALTAIGKPAVPELLETFNHARPQVRIQIMRSLAEIGDHRAISTMLKATEEDSAMLNYWAQEGLERLGLNMVYIKPE